MTTLPLTLDRVTCRLPDGRALFNDLSFSFEPVATGLVGANGVGKSMLGRLLAGTLAPSSGRCHGGGRVFLLPALSGEPQGRLGDLAGVGNVLDALDRIAEGSTDPADFTLAEGQWDLHNRLLQHWQDSGLPAHLQPGQPARQLSGGQAMQVALSGAWASAADWLILDEPSNHLDARHRAQLQEALAQWRGGLLVISHDRALLQQMTRIVELSASGLQRFSGPYSVYEEEKAAQRTAAQDRLDHARHQHRLQQRQSRDLQERAQQRQARGDRRARDANQAPILLGLQKQRAQASAGRHAQLQEQRLDDSASRLRDAAAAVEQRSGLVAFAPEAQRSAQRVLKVERLVLPHGCAIPLDLLLQRGQRLALVGDNGSGKSSLLRVLAGQLTPRSGDVDVAVKAALLDQQLSSLADTDTALSALQSANDRLGSAELRTRLALLGLDAQRLQRPVATLSAGERLKAALACVLYADPVPGLLLLDEPGNALDLDALQVLEGLLDQYRGSLIMASHDERLLQAMQPTHTLRVSTAGWQLQAA